MFLSDTGLCSLAECVLLYFQKQDKFTIESWVWLSIRGERHSQNVNSFHKANATFLAVLWQVLGTILFDSLSREYLGIKCDFFFPSYETE